MIEIVTVSSKGQLVIPEKVRRRLGIRPGAKLVLFERNGDILLKKEKDVAKHLEESERKEEMGWLTLAEQSLRELWDNPKDERVWSKYL